VEDTGLMHLRQPQVPTIDVLEAARAVGDPPTAGPGAGGGLGPGADAAGDPAAPRGTPLLVDVRERDEFTRVRAPGAVLYPTSSFLLRFDDLPRDRPLHVVCHSGSRSAAVTAFLLRNGWSDVHNVAGGMTSWVGAGLPVRRGPLDAGEGDLA
jgi:rhodanese-related sulfurtransferase